jgi:hypothetical protein
LGHDWARAASCARRSPHCERRSRAASTPNYLDEAIDELSGAIEEQLGPFAPAAHLLRSATRSSPPPGACSRPARPTPTPGGDFFARREPERTRKRLVGQLERLGYTVTLQEEAAPT